MIVGGESTNQEYARKRKLLKLAELLKRESSIDKPLKTADIIDRLSVEGVCINRRTLPEDIRLLNEFGYDIITSSEGKSNTYYCNQDNWNISDVKILIDSIQASRFISKEKTQDLINKIVKLCNEDEEYILRTNLVCFNTIKAPNDEIEQIVELIETALIEKKKISFLYFDINWKGIREYRKEGSRYEVDPVSLVYHEDFYYLVTWNEKHNNFTNYRLDRMADIKKENKKICEEARSKAISKKAEKYAKQAFKMFGNKELSTVEIIFDKTIIGAIYDKFGYDIELEEIGENKFKTQVEIYKSPTWEGWVYQFDEKIEVIEQIKKDL